jgi:hypothetical protein
MSNPDQDKALATISSLAHSLDGQVLSDIQIDLLMVAEHLMTNIAVQSTLHGRLALDPSEPKPLEFQIGEPVMIETPPSIDCQPYWQRTTIIDKVEGPALEGGFEYKTAFTGRDMWIGVRRLKKAEKQ